MKTLSRQEVARRARQEVAQRARPDVAQRARPDVARRETTPAAADVVHSRGSRAKVALIALAVAAPAGLAVGGAAWMTRTPGFAVRRVIVTGAQHASVESLVRRSGAVGRNAFALDLADVRARLLGDPWVADATVRRAPPHELRVAITERVPAACEKSGPSVRVLGADGRVLADAGGEGFALPLVDGLARVPEESRDARRALAAATLAALRDGAPELFAAAQSIDASQDGKLVLLAKDCPPIWLSGPQSADEARTFVRRRDGIVNAIRSRTGSSNGPSAIDARWKDRLYVVPSAIQRGTAAITLTVEPRWPPGHVPGLHAAPAGDLRSPRRPPAET